MHEVLFSFVYALTSAKFLFFSMYRIVLKVAGPRKNPIKGLQQAPKTKSLFKDGVARKPHPILWHLHITITWNYLTGVNVACRKIKPYIKRQEGETSCSQISRTDCLTHRIPTPVNQWTLWIHHPEHDNRLFASSGKLWVFPCPTHLSSVLSPVEPRPDQSGSWFQLSQLLFV